jgi:protein gp37
VKETKIQWCHSTINPAMACDGCELWPRAGVIKNSIFAAVVEAMRAQSTSIKTRPEEEMCNGSAMRDLVARDLRILIDASVANKPLSAIYRDRKVIAKAIAGQSKGVTYKAVVDAIRRSAKCYAGLLGTMRAGHKGYAKQFEIPKMFPDRMAKAAKWKSPSLAEQAAKPWLDGCPRMTFVSDMGDALSESISFEYLRDEIIATVVSPQGQRQIWLWLSKRPGRMAEFGLWLAQRGIAWPKNLVAMTTVTSQGTAGRIDQLRRVPSALKGLSIEPLFEQVTLDLRGIDWLIVGGGSDTLAAPFHLEWVVDLHAQCKKAGVAFFLKQFGKNPMLAGSPLKLMDRHGGNWDEWPAHLRIREVPPTFRRLNSVPAESV